jgi:nucleoside-diphosphate kinase
MCPWCPCLLLASPNPKHRVLCLEVEAMEAMGVLARTAAPLAGTGRRPSGAVRPTASLSFAAAATRSSGRLAVGVSAWSRRAAGARRAVPRGIVASAVGYSLHAPLDSVTCICWRWSE